MADAVTTTDPAPRMPQITEAERSHAVRAMFDAIAGVGNAEIEHHHVLMTFAQHPALTHKFLDFNAHLLIGSTLPVRLRQIAILRTAWEKKVRYMWASHVRLSLSLGLTGEDIEAVKSGAAAPHWTGFERALIRATDQLLVQTNLDDELWATLSAEFSRQQIMDLLFTIGAYVLLAMVFNATQIQREPELIALAQIYGSPA